MAVLSLATQRYPEALPSASSAAATGIFVTRISGTTKAVSLTSAKAEAG